MRATSTSRYPWVRCRSVRRPPRLSATRSLAAVLVAAALVTVALVTAACGGDGDPVADNRADQVRVAADRAGLTSEVADVLALAARGTAGTFQVTYAGTGGAQVVVSQQPPNRRVDVLTAGLIVESQVVRDGVAYRCALPDGGRPGDDLDCTRTQGVVQAAGAFTSEALDDFTDQVLASSDTLDITVDHRTVADAEVTCLVTTPKAGSALDGTGPGADTLCLSEEGAQLLVDSGGERLVADSYTTDVPRGTFDV